MPYGPELFKQDMRAAKKAFDASDFEHLNVIANRIMSNVFLLGGNRQLAIAGFMIKDINMYLLALKQSTKARSISSARSALQLVLAKVADLAPDSSKMSELWDTYYASFKSLRMHLQDESEIEVYTGESSEITHESLGKLIEYLNKHIDVFLNPENNLLNTTLTEVTRFYTAYGITKGDLQVRSLITVLNWIENYINTISTDESTYISAIRQLELPFLERITKFAAAGDESNSQIRDDLLSDMIMVWRDLFMKYAEVQTSTQQQSGRRQSIVSRDESKMELSKTTREKLADLVTKGIEDQIKGNK